MGCVCVCVCVCACVCVDVIVKLLLTHGFLNMSKQSQCQEKETDAGGNVKQLHTHKHTVFLPLAASLPSPPLYLSLLLILTGVTAVTMRVIPHLSCRWRQHSGTTLAPEQCSLSNDAGCSILCGNCVRGENIQFPSNQTTSLVVGVITVKLRNRASQCVAVELMLQYVTFWVTQPNSTSYRRHSYRKQV